MVGAAVGFQRQGRGAGRKRGWDGAAAARPAWWPGGIQETMKPINQWLKVHLADRP